MTRQVTTLDNELFAGIKNANMKYLLKLRGTLHSTYIQGVNKIESIKNTT